jgi:hypothetical protein
MMLTVTKNSRDADVMENGPPAVGIRSAGGFLHKIRD